MSLHNLIFFTLLYSWVGVVGVWIVTRGERKWVLGSLGVYFSLLVIEDLFAAGPPLDFLRLWVWYLIPTAAVILFLTRPLRGVGTLVLGAMMAAILGSQVFLVTVVGAEPLLRLWVELMEGLGITDVDIAFWSIHVAGFLLSLLVAIPVVWLLAHWYARNGFSDQMLLLGSVFLVFSLDSSLSIKSSDWAAFGTGLLAFAGIGLLALLAYRILRDPPAPASLLMLRVFASRPWGHRLLDGISARWRYLGPVRMIGGPDLAVASVEPDEFLTFVSGRLRRLFIEDAGTLEERLRTLDSRPDPDGRFRVDEFFCFDDTWRFTVSGLLQGSDVVVMDLRDFGPDNQGCLVEIEMLVAAHAMARTVFLVDETTDRVLLDKALGPGSGGGPTIVEAPDDETAVEAVAACVAVAGTEPTASGGRFTRSD
jgi:hypothetical protein